MEPSCAQEQEFTNTGQDIPSLIGSRYIKTETVGENLSGFLSNFTDFTTVIKEEHINISKQIFADQTELTVEIKKTQGVNESQMYDVNFKDRKTKNEEFYIKEENLASNESRSKQIFADQTVLMVEIKKTEGVNEPQQMYDVNFEDRKIKNEELDIKEEHWASNESSSAGTVHNPQHQTVHAVNGRVNKFNCKECSYKSEDITNITKHLLWHPNLGTVEWLHCDHCAYRTEFKSEFNRHIVRHRGPGELKIFRCDHCDYQTIHKSSICGHLLRHKNRGAGGKTFKCDNSSY